MRSVQAGANLLLALLLAAGVSNAQQNNNNNNKNKEVKMSTIQSNKEVARRLYEQCLNQQNLQLLPDLVSDDFTGAQGKKGAAAFGETLVPLINAFPDIQYTIEDLVGEDDKVVVRWKWQGTHTGTFAGFAPTGRIVTNEGVGVFNFKDGKIVSAAVQTDRLGFLQALGVLPANPASLSNGSTHKDKVSFIDKFFIPAAAKKEFYDRMSINRDFIKKLPGFITDAAYVHTDDNGNLICITVAQWENKEAMNKARETVQAEYKKQGFDMAEMVKRLNITVDRGIYTELDH
jgi:steroid delta-isomerase-like uncharacterized protein